MKLKTFYFKITLFSFFTIFSSCGGNKQFPPSQDNSVQNFQAQAKECGCNTISLPICGLNSSGIEKSFENKCIAECLGFSYKRALKCDTDQSSETTVCFYHSGTQMEEIPETSATQYLINKFGSNFTYSNYASSIYYGKCTQAQM